MITAKIDVTKINKEYLYQGKNGKYLDFALHDKKTEYGDGYITQSVPKAAREKGIKGDIIGNWKRIQKAVGGGRSSAPASASQEKPATAAEDDSVPF